MTRAYEQKIAAGLVLGGLLLVYWPVITGLVDAWSTDDNYSHGFFIVPLAAYFAWERRRAFAAAAHLAAACARRVSAVARAGRAP